jgi:hypothetical protein
MTPSANVGWSIVFRSVNLIAATPLTVAESNLLTSSVGVDARDGVTTTPGREPQTVWFCLVVRPSFIRMAENT